MGGLVKLAPTSVSVSYLEQNVESLSLSKNGDQGPDFHFSTDRLILRMCEFGETPVPREPGQFPLKTDE